MEVWWTVHKDKRQLFLFNGGHLEPQSPEAEPLKFSKNPNFYGSYSSQVYLDRSNGSQAKMAKLKEEDTAARTTKMRRVMVLRRHGCKQPHEEPKQYCPLQTALAARWARLRKHRDLLHPLSLAPKTSPVPFHRSNPLFQCSFLASFRTFPNASIYAIVSFFHQRTV
ncbi:leucoanthocyanidin dioxygenase-like [Gossypium australe]|uniref:Leucoanthocyanidin dioxygenase-like n=1 Tax=Gossypium australe TaxID=47621 RepID=A0A5B6UQT4_9ROSI|nr:leucoanthocyanidin dioxygenase-like [Gossypium australe]